MRTYFIDIRGVVHTSRKACIEANQTY